ncbi:hypothetical protein ACLX1H_006458 [Fusarium chlamydosporum]
MKIVRLLLKYGADPNSRPELVNSHTEAKKAQYAKAPYPNSFTHFHFMVLLAKFANEIRSKWNAGTVFHYADEEMTRLLLKHGADPNLQDNDFKISVLSLSVMKHRRAT